MELEVGQIIQKLEKSLEKDYGDYGRTQYIIEKLQKDQLLPKSDNMYIERMINLCEPFPEEAESQIIFDNAYPEDLIKCFQCDLKIKLDEKSIRKNDFWFHEKCFEKIPIT